MPEEPIEEDISRAEAFKRADILLSFRQINGFQFNQDSHCILFKFYCIAIQHLQIGTTVHFRVYLISNDETKDTELSNATCILEKDTQSDGEQTQFEFNCKIDGLKDNKNYNSFEIYDSIDVAGVPKDKTLLNGGVKGMGWSLEKDSMGLMYIRSLGKHYGVDIKTKYQLIE